MANEIRKNNMFNIFDNVDSWMNNWTTTDSSIMNTDVAETEDQYELSIDLPGLQKDDINLNYKNNILTISVQRDTEQSTQNDNSRMIMRERHYGSFSRQYRIPQIDSENISAKYDNGTLVVDLPKAKATSADDGRINVE